MIYKICRGKVDFNAQCVTACLAALFAGKRASKREIAGFEREFAGYIGTEHAIAVSCAKTSLAILLKVLNAKADDEVIVPAYTVPEVIDVIVANGLKPVFVDIGPSDANMDHSLIEKEISERTRFILMTHMHGKPCAVGPILEIARKHNITVIEDAAQACGAQYKGRKTGIFGKAGYFSFGMLKNINTLSGSMIVTDDDALAVKIKEHVSRLRPAAKRGLFFNLLKTVVLSWFTSGFVFSLFIYPVLKLLGKKKDQNLNRVLMVKPLSKKDLEKFDARFSAAQAVLGRLQLEILDKANERRISNARILNKRLSGIKQISLFETEANSGNIYLNYVIRTADRQGLIDFLFKNGVDTSPGFVKDCSGLEQFKPWGYRCPNSQRLEKENIYLPVYYPLGDKEMERIADLIKEYYGADS